MKNVLLLFVLFCSMTMLFGQTPSTLSLQGVLREPTGVASPDNDYAMTFKIYDVATGGTALWSENQTVRVTNGLYSVQLGAVTALNLTFDRQYYVGITVGGTELAPRMVLTAAPYAMGLKGSSNIFGGGGAVGIGTTVPVAGTILDVNGVSLFRTGTVNIWTDLLLGTQAAPRNFVHWGNLGISGTINNLTGADNANLTLKSGGWGSGAIRLHSADAGANNDPDWFIQRGVGADFNNKVFFHVPNSSILPGAGFGFYESGGIELMSIVNGTGDVKAKGYVKAKDQFVPVSGAHRTVILSGVVRWINGVPSFKWKTHEGLTISNYTSDTYWTEISLPAGYTFNYLAGVSLTGVQFGNSSEPKMHLFSRINDENSNKIWIHQSWFNNNDPHASSWSIVIVLNVPA